MRYICPGMSHCGQTTEDSLFRIATALEIIAVQGFDKELSTCKTEDDIYEYFKELRISHLNNLRKEEENEQEDI